VDPRLRLELRVRLGVPRIAYPFLFLQANWLPPRGTLHSPPPLLHPLRATFGLDKTSIHSIEKEDALRNNSHTPFTPCICGVSFRCCRIFAKSEFRHTLSPVLGGGANLRTICRIEPDTGVLQLPSWISPSSRSTGRI
jgi:hypothetical protein